MKILFIANMYPSESNPSYGAFIKNIFNGIKNQHYNIHLISISGKARNFFSKVFKYFSFYLRIFLTRTDQFDIIYLSFPSHTYLPFLVRKIDPGKLVVRLHGSDLIPPFVFPLSKLLKKSLHASILKSRVLVVPSAYFKNKLMDVLDQRGLHINTDKILVNPSGGVNLEIFHPTENNSSVFRIGYIGHLHAEKGIFTLLEATRKLNFPHNLQIIGTGPEKANIVHFVKKHGLQQRINLKDEMHHTELAHHYNTFSVFVFPTMRVQESFGNVAIEALACGVPVIGSDMAAVSEYLTVGYNGLLFEPGNPKDLATKLEYFYKLPTPEKKAFRIRARSSVKDYSSINVTKRFIQEIEKIKPENS